jgi:hypothetical protein
LNFLGANYEETKKRNCPQEINKPANPTAAESNNKHESVKTSVVVGRLRQIRSALGSWDFCLQIVEKRKIR